MRILVDGQPLQTGSRFRGIGRYTEGLIEGLCKNGAEVIVLFNASDSVFCEAIQNLLKLVPETKIEVFYAIGNYNSLNINGVDYFVSSKLYEEVVNRIKPDVFVCPSAFEIRQNFIVPPLERISKSYPVAVVDYDLIPFEDFDRYLPNSEDRSAYLSVLRSFLSADLFLCISRFTENQLKKYFPEVTTATILGASFTEEVNNIQQKEYIFYCGGLDDRKNVDFLCRAYSRLPNGIRSKHPLYICCRTKSSQANKLTKLIKRLNVSDGDIRLVEAETNTELARLYAECKLFIFPSLMEGLGLPLIEALTFQAPILTSNAASLPEIIDNPESWFSPFDEQQLATKIEKVLTDSSALERLKGYSVKNTSKFTWESVGNQTLAFLELLVDKKTNSGMTSDADLSGMVLPEELRYQYKLAKFRQNVRTIYFDVSSYHRIKNHTGIQRIVNKFIQYLPEKLCDCNFNIEYLICDNGRYFIADCLDGRWSLLAEAQPSTNDWYMSVDLCCGDSACNENKLIEWKQNGVKIFIYVYDLVFEKNPEYVCNTEVVSVLKKWLRFVARNADCILSDSNSVISEFIEWASSEEIDISKTIFLPQHLGSDIVVSDTDPNCLARIDKVYQFICVSTIEPRKGYLILLKAFIEALDNGMDARLVVVGRPGWKASEEIQLLQNNKYAGTKIIWENDCSDGRLQSLYKQSDCFIFASYYEGFGLGIVEAARYGLPLLLRDIPVFRELAGNHALYFNDDCLVRYLTEVASGKVKLPSVKGMEVLTWEQSVYQTAQKLIDISQNEFFSYVKRPDEKVPVESISELFSSHTSESNLSDHSGNQDKGIEQPIVFRTFTNVQQIKFRILSKIWPTKSRRHYYKAKANGVVCASISTRKLPLLKRLKYSFGSCCALTEGKRRHYADKLRRGI